MHKDGLHYHDTRNREITLVQTVQENEEGYSQRQIQDAKKARKLYAKVGYLSARDFKNIISYNLILNCPVTTSDVVCADKFYGRDIHALKVKTTRTKPQPVVIDYLVMLKNILENNKESLSALTLCLSTKFRSSQQ